MKVKYMSLILNMLLFSSCSSVQHIRKNAYYNHEWGVLGVISNSGDYKKTAKHHPIFANDSDFSDGVPTVDRNINYFFWGKYPSNVTVDINKECNDKGLKQAFVEHSFTQSVITFVTFGLYSPRNLKIWCNDEA